MLCGPSPPAPLPSDGRGENYCGGRDPGRRSFLALPWAGMCHPFRVFESGIEARPVSERRQRGRKGPQKWGQPMYSFVFYLYPKGAPGRGGSWVSIVDCRTGPLWALLPGEVGGWSGRFPHPRGDGPCADGTDAGPGIVWYDLYVSANKGPWTAWLLGTTNTCGTFMGQTGSSYGFYSVAHDGAGNAGIPAGIAEATTFVAGGSPPFLAIALAGQEVLLSWPTNADATSFRQRRFLSRKPTGLR